MKKIFKKYICEHCNKEFEEYYFKRFCSSDCRIFYKYGDITGKKFNRLQVIKLSYSDGRRRWLCKYDCGNEVIVSTDHLMKGKTKSCGCLNNERISNLNKLPQSEAYLNRVYDSYKRRADDNNLKFELDKNFFNSLVTKNCFYCNASPKREYVYSKNSNGSILLNGIDRVDNNRGYEIDNVVPCCTLCNIMKKAMSQEDFINHIIKISKNFINPKIME